MGKKAVTGCPVELAVKMVGDRRFFGLGDWQRTPAYEPVGDLKEELIFSGQPVREPLPWPLSVFSEPCPFYPGKTVQQTHAVFMDVDGRWHLMPRQVIPGSLKKTLEEQRKALPSAYDISELEVVKWMHLLFSRKVFAAFKGWTAGDTEAAPDSAWFFNSYLLGRCKNGVSYGLVGFHSSRELCIEFEEKTHDPALIGIFAERQPEL